MDKLIDQLNFIYNNINAAQKLIGALSMSDCRHFVISVDMINDLLTQPKTMEDRHRAAFDTIEKTCQVMQKQGVFSLIGSTQLINALDMIRMHMSLSK